MKIGLCWGGTIFTISFSIALIRIWSPIYYRDHMEFFGFYLSVLILMVIKTHLLCIFLELTFFFHFFFFRFTRSLDDVKCMNFFKWVCWENRWMVMVFLVFPPSLLPQYFNKPTTFISFTGFYLFIYFFLSLLRN